MTNPHKIETVSCANCGKVKRESNHWFIVRIVAGMFECYPFERTALLDDMRPVCGQACAQTELERWMTEIRNAPQKAVEQLEKMIGGVR